MYVSPRKIAHSDRLGDRPRNSPRNSKSGSRGNGDAHCLAWQAQLESWRADSAKGLRRGAERGAGGREALLKISSRKRKCEAAGCPRCDFMADAFQASHAMAAYIARGSPSDSPILLRSSAVISMIRSEPAVHRPVPSPDSCGIPGVVIEIPVEAAITPVERRARFQRQGVVRAGLAAVARRSNSSRRRGSVLSVSNRWSSLNQCNSPPL